MRAHIFITDNETYPLVRDYGFYGSKLKGNFNSIDGIIKENLNKGQKPYFKIINDLLGTRIGDLVFLYENHIGFHGVYKVKSGLFFDMTPIGCIGNEYPLRIDIECTSYFSEPVPEDYLFTNAEYETTFWAWFYKKTQPYGGARAVTTIDPDATRGLISLLVKVNGNTSEPPKKKLYPHNNDINFNLPLKSGKVELEDILRGYLVRNIDNPDSVSIRDMLGPSEDIEWFANNVPYHVTGKNIDILCYHANYKYTDIPLRYRYTVIELKKDRAKDDDINQLIGYSKWVAGRLANGETNIVQPIIIAFDFSDSAVKKAVNTGFNDRGIGLYKYRVEDDDITFIKTGYDL